MDRFEQMKKDMTPMSPEGKGTRIAQLKAMCICGECPSYTECNLEKMELLFCLQGRSNGCPMSATGCICPNCPVTVTIGLSHSYYCMRGAEGEQRGK